MRSAPPVSLSCGRGLGWRCLLAAVPAVAAGALAVWALQHLGHAIWPAAVAAVLVGLIAWQRAPARPVLLAWDGQQWLADGRSGELALMLDTGPWMLLRWRGNARTLWLPVSARAAGAHWHGLRVAAHATPAKAHV